MASDYQTRVDLDEADIVTAIVKLEPDKRTDALELLCVEIGPDCLVEALSRQGWQVR